MLILISKVHNQHYLKTFRMIMMMIWIFNIIIDQKELPKDEDRESSKEDENEESSEDENEESSEDENEEFSENENQESLEDENEESSEDENEESSENENQESSEDENNENDDNEDELSEYDNIIYELSEDKEEYDNIIDKVLDEDKMPSYDNNNEFASYFENFTTASLFVGYKNIIFLRMLMKILPKLFIILNLCPPI